MNPTLRARQVASLAFAIASAAPVLSFLAPLAVAAETAEQKYVLSIERIWDRSAHAAFTDVIALGDHLYCTFREGSDHVPGLNGVIRVIRTRDGANWQSVATLEEQHADLRDPKLSVTPDGRLLVNMGASFYHGKERLGIESRVAFAESDCKTFGAPLRVVFPKEMAATGNWLWRITWHEGAAWGCVQQLHDDGPADSRRALRLVRSRDAIHFEEVARLDVDSPSETTLRFLAELGFNRVSIGVQDFDPRVQQAVHRIQSEAVTRAAIEEARAAGFRSVNLDLIYGLPLQTVESFARTLERVIALAPDRIALYNYAHLPAMFKPQRRIAAADLPSPEAKLGILTLAIGRLTGAGYVYIGMDHFARPDDALAVAQRHGLLQRNFQGYSTHPDCDMLALGISAIGRVGPTYAQNVKTLEQYYERLDAGRLPVARGMALAPDDLVRRAVIHALACNFHLSIEGIELGFLIDFRQYFAAELADLARLEEDGLVTIAPGQIDVTPRGRLLVRSICMVFDRYLREKRARATYSKVV